MPEFDQPMSPQRPYLIRALYEWILDNDKTPYVMVQDGAGVQVPPGTVSDGKVTLNISPVAVRNLELTNDSVRFSARFGGVLNQVYIPINNVLAIYARENGEGLALPPVEEMDEAVDAASAAPSSVPGLRSVDKASGESLSDTDEANVPAQAESDDADQEPTPVRPSGRPSLKVVK